MPTDWLKRIEERHKVNCGCDAHQDVVKLARALHEIMTSNRKHDWCRHCGHEHESPHAEWCVVGGAERTLAEVAGEPNYPCDRCGKPRTKAEGGTTFTVCDECWDARWASRKRRLQGGRVEQV